MTDDDCEQLGGDMAFSYAIRLAAEAFRDHAYHFRSKKQQESLAPLINILKDKDYKIGMTERYDLVDLLTGKYVREVGRPKNYLENKRREDILIKVFKIVQERKMKKMKQPHLPEACKIVAKQIVPMNHNETRDDFWETIQKWVDNWPRREKMVLKDIAAGKYPHEFSPANWKEIGGL